MTEIDVSEEQQGVLQKRSKSKTEISRKRRELKRNVEGWLFSCWPFVGFMLFSGIPFVLSIFLSFTELHSFDILEWEFVGFDNYKWVLFGEQTEHGMRYEFWHSLKQTLYYCLSIPLNLVLSLGIAVLLTRHVKGTKFFRTVLFIPHVCSSVGVSMMWKFIFDPTYGVINSLIRSAGGQTIDFFGSPDWFMPIIILTSTWSAGAGSLLFQAALENVNQTLIEAAELDGGTPTKIFFKITLPSISPTLFYVLTMDIIGGLQCMGQMQIITNGTRNPYNEQGYSESLSAVYLIYWMGFSDPFNYGLGLSSAAAWVLTLIILAFTRLNFWLSKYWVHDDV